MVNVGLEGMKKSRKWKGEEIRYVVIGFEIKRMNILKWKGEKGCERKSFKNVAKDAAWDRGEKVLKEAFKNKTQNTPW